LTGIRFNSFSTLDTAVGNIMEARILDEVGVDRNISFGKFIESSPVEDRQELLKILKSLVSIDEPF
jgi:hypothetical protein